MPCHTKPSAMKHTRLHTCLLALLMAAAVSIQAQRPPIQTFLVGSVTKSVILYQGDKKLAVTPGDELPLNAMITVPEGGQLMVYNKAKLRQYTIMQAGTFSLAEFLQGSRKKNVPAKSLEGIISLITSKGKLPSGFATIDREICTDSVASDTLTQE